MTWRSTLAFLLNAGRDPQKTLPEHLAQIRIITKIFYVYFFTGIFLAAFHFYDGLPAVAYVISIALILGTLNLICLFYFDAIQLNAQIGVAIIFSACLANVLIWGGYTGPNFSWLLFVPILAALLINTRAMWGYFFLIVMSMVAIIVMHQHEIIPFYSGDFPGYFTAIVLHRFGLVALICIVLQAYYSERQRYENSIRELSVRARLSNQEKDRFISSVSHDIRKPLKDILEIAEKFQGTEMTSDQRFLIHNISHRGHTILYTLNDAIDYAKIEAEKFSIKKNQFDLHESLTHCLSDFKADCREKQNTLTLELSHGLPLYVQGDQVSYERIIHTLLKNAVEFTQAGKICVRVSYKSMGDHQIRLITQIEDTGSGMSESTQNKILNSFTHSDDSIVNQFAGVGLGLTIADRLVKRLGGQLHLESTLGKGSLFCFDSLMELTDKAVTSTLPERMIEEIDLEPKDRLTGHILIGEDNTIIQALIKSQMDRLGLTCEIATQDEQILSALKAKHFDLMIVDCRLPHINGQRLAKTIRGEPSAYRHIPIILIANASQPDILTNCMAAGMDDYILKPFNHANIRETLAKWLKHDSIDG